MTSESFFALVVAGIIALFFGSVLLFGGYRFFMFLLPVWGFFFGFGLGAETVQAVLGDAFLSTVTSWVVGFVVALIFAVLSYLFYFAGVALVAGGAGYAVGVALVEAIGLNFGLIAWLVGMVLGVALAVIVLVFNVQKWVVIAATSILGAGIIIGTFLFLLGGLPESAYVENPVRMALQGSPLWTIALVLLAILGVFAQFESTRRVEIETYNRLSGLSGS